MSRNFHFPVIVAAWSQLKMTRLRRHWSASKEPHCLISIRGQMSKFFVALWKEYIFNEMRYIGIVSIYLILPATLGHWVYSVPNRNEYQQQKRRFYGVEPCQFVRLTTSPPSVSRLSRQCGISISQLYGLPRPVMRIATLYNSISRNPPNRFSQCHILFSRTTENRHMCCTSNCSSRTAYIYLVVRSEIHYRIAWFISVSEWSLVIEHGLMMIVLGKASTVPHR
jgi:hypothetical protein